MEHVEFDIVTDTTEAGRRIAVRGDLDLATAHELVSALDSGLDSGEAVVLVLEECTFLDSSALKAIADASRRAAAAGLRFAVSRPSVQAARVLELSGLNEIVTIETSDYP